MSVSQICWRLERGTFERQGVGVLRIAGSPASWEQQLIAGLLDLGPEALVSHRAAAALHGFDGFPRTPVEFIVPRSARNRGVRWTVHSSRRLEPIDRAAVGLFAC